MSVPDLLTVEEAARVLRIGRSAAYELVARYASSDGAEGLPVIRVGRLLRVPRAALEAFVGISITDIPPTRSRPRPPLSRATPVPLLTVDDEPRLPLV